MIERPVYYHTTGQVSAFEFVLRHERGCQAVAVHDCPELRSFLRGLLVAEDKLLRGSEDFLHQFG